MATLWLTSHHISMKPLYFLGSLKADFECYSQEERQEVRHSVHHGVNTVSVTQERDTFDEHTTGSRQDLGSIAGEVFERRIFRRSSHRRSFYKRISDRKEYHCRQSHRRLLLGELSFRSLSYRRAPPLELDLHYL